MRCKLRENLRCQSELFISILASMHVHCPDPCHMTKSVLRVHVHAACPCPYCMSMSMLHVHVNAACPCQCCMSISMSMYIYIEMPECWTVRHPVSLVPDWKQLMMLKQVQYRTKLTQSSIFFTRLKFGIADVGVSFLDADAQIWPIHCYPFPLPLTIPTHTLIQINPFVKLCSCNPSIHIPCMR